MQPRLHELIVVAQPDGLKSNHLTMLQVKLGGELPGSTENSIEYEQGEHVGGIFALLEKLDPIVSCGSFNANNVNSSSCIILHSI
jgi:hypothetical protein